MEPTAAAPSTWKALACGALLFLGVDLALFRWGPYAWLAKPDSSAGWVVRRTLLEPSLRPAVQQPSVLLLGDSTMNDACIPELLRAELGAPSLCVRPASIPGTTPRVWPFLFARVPAPPGGFRVAVVGLHDFDDDLPGGSLRDRALDLAFLGPFLSCGEAADVAADFDSANARRDAWLCACCRIYAWRRDLQDLLLAPSTRSDAAHWQYWWLAKDPVYAGVAHSLAGVRWADDQVVGLSAADEGLAAVLRGLVQPAAAVDDAPYRRRWLGRLADLATAAGTELVFVRMPTQVLPRAVPRPRNSAVLDELARRPHVRVLDRDLFVELERPEFFYDAVHLNRAGAEQFTRRLAAALLAACGPQLGR